MVPVIKRIASEIMNAIQLTDEKKIVSTISYSAIKSNYIALTQ